MASPTFAAQPAPDDQFYRQMAARKYLQRRQGGSIAGGFPELQPSVAAPPATAPPFQPPPQQGPQVPQFGYQAGVTNSVTMTPGQGANVPGVPIRPPVRPQQPPPGMRGHANRGGMGGPGVL